MEQIDKRAKVDKGFELIYWNLSYRRKFIRTLWLTPIGALLIFLIVKNPWNIPFYGRNLFANLLIVAIVLTTIVQLIYTYYKWKKEEGQRK